VIIVADNRSAKYKVVMFGPEERLKELEMDRTFVIIPRESKAVNEVFEFLAGKIIRREND